MKILKSPNNIHHLAFLCRDAEQTRWFYEDVMGFKLVAALDFESSPGSGEPLEYMHLFFEMGNGDHIAFFDIPDELDEKDFHLTSGFKKHVAFEISSYSEMMEWKDHLDEHIGNVSTPINHEFVHSIYFYDPNGINLEITCKDKEYDRIMGEDTKNAHGNLKIWTERTRLKKEGRTDQKILDERKVATKDLVDRLKSSNII
jgi:catechol 2,3-dioxygenase-like lactoylglutathione lyase family enzyme